MLEELLEILKNSEADDFEVTQLKITGWEFYFIGHSLDQNRARKTEHIDVKVFKRTEESLGIAGGELPADSSYAEIENFVNDLIAQASLVKNKPYELPEPKETEAITVSIPDRKEEAAKLIDIFNTVHETETEYLNSYEIFSDVTESRFINSRGIDVTETYPSTALEVVINAKNDEHEIELYRYYQKGACDEAEMRKEIEDTLDRRYAPLRQRQTESRRNTETERISDPAVDGCGTGSVPLVPGRSEYWQYLPKDLAFCPGQRDRRRRKRRQGDTGSEAGPAIFRKELRMRWRRKCHPRYGIDEGQCAACIPGSADVLAVSRP